MISYHLKHPIFSTLNHTPRNHDLIRYLHIFACHLDSFRGCLMLGGWEYLHTLWQAQAFIDTDMCNIFTCMFSNIYIRYIYTYYGVSMECRDITIPSLLRQDFTSSSMTSPLIWSLLQTFVLLNRRDIIAGMCPTLQECECWCCSCALCMRRARCDILYIPQLVAFLVFQRIVK